jgi:hypothetical protein
MPGKLTVGPQHPPGDSIKCAYVLRQNCSTQILSQSVADGALGDASLEVEPQLQSVLLAAVS